VGGCHWKAVAFGDEILEAGVVKGRRRWTCRSGGMSLASLTGLRLI
jgi:hypothetical protein